MEWIDVNDKLPDNELEQVLVSLENGYVVLMWCIHDRWCDLISNDYKPQWNKVLYWQQKPKGVIDDD